MIEIHIRNCAEVAKSRSFMARLLPGTLLHSMVEKAIAKKLQEKFAEEGLDVVVNVTKTDD